MLRTIGLMMNVPIYPTSTSAIIPLGFFFPAHRAAAAFLTISERCPAMTFVMRAVRSLSVGAGSPKVAQAGDGNLSIRKDRTDFEITAHRLHKLSKCTHVHIRPSF
jgi:hypothetical protein